MTFYQELQLDQAGSKKYLATFTKPKDKLKHGAIFLLKICLTVAFSVAFVSVFAQIFGPENTIAGVVVLLGVMAFRSTDLDLPVGQSVAVIFVLFGIFAGGPKLANLVAPISVGLSFVVNLVSIFLIVFLGCHNTKKCNHFILVLSYILLLGADTSGWGYYKRLLCLLVGAILTALVLFRNNRRKKVAGGFTKFFKEFRLSSADTRWQIKFTLCVSTALLWGVLLGLPKYIWVGIAAMSVCFPFTERVEYRSIYRIVGNIGGCCLFVALALLLPESLTGYFGILGGFCLGFCVLYGWQAMCNSFSAVAMAAGTFGMRTAVVFRVVNNVFGAVYALMFDLVCEKILLGLDKFCQMCRRKRRPSSNLPAVVYGVHPYEQLVRDLDLTGALKHE